MNHSFEWDWPRAERDFRRALELSPRYGTLHVFYGAYLNAVGRTAEAHEHFVTAQSLEPLSLPINAWLGMDLYFRREYDKSLEQFRKTIDIDPSFGNAHYLMAFTLLEKGMTREALKEMETSRIVTADNPVMVAGHVLALARAGQRDHATKLLDTLLAASKSRYVAPHNLAIAYIAVGDTVNFYRALERTVDERAFNITVSSLRVDPFFDFARTDARFKAIFAKTGLPE
jgi:Tfp pilus assembly protein PilF